eukprot:GDKI01025909.1.p1 GENE.GDKI01025909.1~~GDKI01025909.1.p1  ORF type:complete len:187 (-),score=58.43 GDKI01025909.1:406-966(-)
MKFEAFFLIPLGVVLLVMLMSGIKWVQKLAVQAGHMSMMVGHVKLTLNHFGFFWTLVRFLWQLVCLADLMEWRAHEAVVKDAASEDRIKMKQWRTERNWWICLFGVVVWLSVWRCAAIFAWFWEQIANEEGQVKAKTAAAKAAPTTAMPAPSAPPMSESEMVQRRGSKDTKTGAHTAQDKGGKKAE